MKRTGSWTIAPQVRIPLGSKDEYEVADRLWGGALFLGYETETRLGFFSAGAIESWDIKEERTPFLPRYSIFRELIES